MPASTEPEKTQRAGLHVILDKLHRKLSITDDELQQLQRQVEELEAEAVLVSQKEAVRLHAFKQLQQQMPESKGFVPIWTKTSENMLWGHATCEGVSRFAAHFGKESVAFYGAAQDVLVSSVGLGTCRGAMDDETDAAYATAVHAALEHGINLVDTSLNYRDQRSERAVAAGIHRFVEKSSGRRDGIVVCTKGGYLVPEAISAGTLGPDDVVGGMHSMAPAFLADQIERSRRNLCLETIDVYYLHNPETQLKFVDVSEFMTRIRAAFDQLERAVSDGLIRFYGTATWHGYRGGALALRALAEAAREVAGDNHHFRFIQLPFNLGMREALTHPTESNSNLLELAEELGITVIASASLYKACLSRNITGGISRMLPGLVTEFQRAIQFTRSTPGIASALVGMCNVEHLMENLAVARIPSMTSVEYQRFCSAVY